MLEILKTLKDTPLPIVLVIGGLIFLLIPFIQKISSKEVGVETTNQSFAGLIGFLLLVMGIGLYVVPSGNSVSSSPTAIPPLVIPASETQSISTPIISTPVSSDNLASCQSFQSGETRQVSANTFVVGDVIIEGVNQYDAGGTGESTVAFFEKSVSVTAPWGAGCYTGSNIFIEQVVQRELNYGCGSTCNSVRFIHVKSNGEQSVQYFKK